MKNHIVLGAGSAVVAAACMALFGTGTAAADDYAGQTYADASAAASDAGDIGGRGEHGGRQALDRRLHRDAIADRAVRQRHRRRPLHGQVQFYLNCNGGYATATNPGDSLGSPPGREVQGRRGRSRRGRAERARRGQHPRRVVLGRKGIHPSSTWPRRVCSCRASTLRALSGVEQTQHSWNGCRRDRRGRNGVVRNGYCRCRRLRGTRPTPTRRRR